MQKVFKGKTLKITNGTHAPKVFGSSYNVEISNSELQLKDTESPIKSKSIDFLYQRQGFKFIATLVLVFIKIKRKGKIKYGTFNSSLE